MNNLKELCRICLKSTNERIPIFTTTLTDSQIHVASFLAEITSLEINENEDHAKGICLPCYNKLDEVLRLINQCKCSDKFFKEQLVIKSDEEDNIPLINLLVRKDHVEVEPDILANDEMCLDQQSIDSDKEEPDFHCLICDKSFKSAYSFKRHESRHKGKRRYKCNHCNRRCNTFIGFKSHMKTHSQNYIKKSLKKAFQCTLCSKRFPYRSGLKHHLRGSSGTQSHMCSICSQRFNGMGCLIHHQKTAHINDSGPPFLCSTCGREFTSHSLLVHHMRKHTNERPFVCQTCGANFRETKHLLEHEQRHLGLRTVLCTICGRTVSSGHYSTHMRAHRGEKPYLCMSCGKRFITNDVLKRHLRVHTGERPYVCDVCGKAFNQTNALKTHRVIHSKTVEVGIFEPNLYV